MSMNFPSPVPSGTLFAPPGGPMYIFNDPVWNAIEGALAADISTMLVMPTNGTTAHSLADWFEYMGRKEDVVATGSLWPDIDPTASPLRVGTRILVGAGVDYSGDFNSAFSERSWLGKIPNYDWFEREATVSVVTKYGATGVLGAARARDNVQVPTHTYYDGAAIGVNGIAFADAGAKLDFAGLPLKAWGYYGEAHHGSPDGATGGTALGMELDVVNWANDAYYLNPYNAAPQGSTIGLWLAAGAGQGVTGPPIFPNTVALGIVANRQKWKRGIIFHDGGLVKDANQRSIAIGVARGHQIQQWYGGDDAAPGAIIRFDSADTTNYPQLVLMSTGVQILCAAAENLAFQVITKATAVNGLVLDPGTVGIGPVLRPPSTVGDTNIPVIIQSKGTSSVGLQGGNGTNKVAVNSTGIGFFATSPVAKQTLSAAATDPATTMALVNSIRTALINYGLAV